MGSDWDPLKSEPDLKPSPISLTSPCPKNGLDMVHEKPYEEISSLVSAKPRVSPDVPPTIKWQAPKPRIYLLYKYCSKWDCLLLVTPAIILSATSGLLTPFMTIIIGASFNSFASFPTDHAFSTKIERSQLKSDIAKASYILVAMGVTFVLLNALMAGLWITVGERTVRRLRNEVFTKIGSRNMSWFDLGMGAQDGGDEKVDGNQEATGAAGLMAKFTRETDEVRIATSQNVGLILGDIFTIFASLILALIKSWNLTLVILSAVPVIIICQGVVQHISFPMLSRERRIFAAASTRSERATSSIATVKAFNAEKKEVDGFFSVIDQGKKVTAKIILIWGTNLGLSAFILNSMFVAGLWYGSELVRQGGIEPGDVITVFFATILASSSFQTIMPRFESIQKGMGAMVSLQVLINPPPPPPSQPVIDVIINSVYSSSSADRCSMISSPTPCASSSIMETARPIPGRKRHRRNATLTQIRPVKCHGEFILRHVSFAYPSRPQSIALSNVTLFLPSGEFTFIVGCSGSGKSTVAQLLLQLYKPTAGSISMDDQNINMLDPGWMKENIASVQQGCVLFDLTVHENVAIGLAGSKTRRPEDATREEVIEACRKAFIHEFIADLPDGYDTVLGTSGASLSGGQKQRMAIARAILRDPPVLILDEATSALDPTARVLVFEAIRFWRKNRTTIVITHDLSQIEPDNFVYVIQNGSIVEEGFRSDLDRADQAFSRMAQEQQKAPLDTKLDENDDWDGSEADMDVLQHSINEQENPFTGPNLSGAIPPTSGNTKRQAHQQGAYFDILAGYTDKPRLTQQFSSLIFNNGHLNLNRPESSDLFSLPHAFNPDDLKNSTSPGNPFSNRARSTVYDASLNEFMVPTAASTVLPTPEFNSEIALWAHLEKLRLPKAVNQDSQHLSFNRMNGRTESLNIISGESTLDLERQGEVATRGRAGLLYPGSRIDRRRNNSHLSKQYGPQGNASKSEMTVEKIPGVISVIWTCIKSCPFKPLLALGFVTSIGQGAITPIWSDYLSTLMTLVAQGGGSPSELQQNSLIVLSLSVANGLSISLSMIALDIVSNQWACDMRDKCFRQIMAQQKVWFDRTENSPSSLSQTLIKDVDDMLGIVSDIPGKFMTSIVMISMGIIWAAVVGWKLTLVGVAVIPALSIAVGVQFKLLNMIELKNKRAREEIAKIFHEMVANIRAIRAMSLESVFIEEFNTALESAYSTGLKGACVQGIGNGLMNGLVYFVEALLFYVIAVFMCDGSYTYATALRVFSLIVFSLTFGAQLLSFLPNVAKAKQAALDFQGLIARSSEPTEESRGTLRPKITGQITFSDVRFAYPTRPEVDVLSGVSFEINPGECVAIVGGSGSGKSTITALLQKLYEPRSGSIHLDRHSLAESEAKWIREHISIVSQTPALFDMTVTENVAYGTHQLPFSEVERACKAAQVHNFLLSLPQGYETNLGENASLISGGQAQRLQIARALVKRADILILDECTSALDSENQAAVLETIMRVRMGRTVIMVTHKLPAMMACSRILVVHSGKIVEDGTYDELVRKRGVFAELARGGEWE